MSRALGSLAALVALAAVAQPAFTQHRQAPVWQESFHRRAAQPDPATWTYDEGGGGWGNGELETYCAYGSSKPPCDPAQPNAFVGKDGYLHIVARKTSDGAYTSARLLSLGRKTFRYGRVEARIKVPAGQGLWPAFWMLGADSETNHWPKCGEVDVMEQLGREPATVHGTIHGVGFKGVGIGKPFENAGGTPFSQAFHNFGVLWKPDSIAFYVDDPAKPYAVFTPKNLPAGAVWPFNGRPFYLLLNLAVGGGWPGPPSDATRFPATMLVGSIKVWKR